MVSRIFRSSYPVFAVLFVAFGCAYGQSQGSQTISSPMRHAALSIFDNIVEMRNALETGHRERADVLEKVIDRELQHLSIDDLEGADKDLADCLSELDFLVVTYSLRLEDPNFETSSPDFSTDAEKLTEQELRNVIAPCQVGVESMIKSGAADRLDKCSRKLVVAELHKRDKPSGP